eukprot:CAMPEP_0179134306 /NCGR_PEP_ID=MMETSP0796-20121207/63902_1 /TAXON_ID=73915 /ORGANISM="Pyrodinium bahamense, Strain pbaha01" /LENGTH=74 /DNA_ID=CAMNT_0020833293 /DNA_START=1 /DNA_END=221 /DNA_ORIENTATION=-
MTAPPEKPSQGLQSVLGVDKLGAPPASAPDVPPATGHDQFANVDDRKHGDPGWTKQRKQQRIVVEDLPTVIGPA